MKQTIKTANYNFTKKDLADRLHFILYTTNNVLQNKISESEYISFIERQLKEIQFINLINEAKKSFISEVEIDG